MALRQYTIEDVSARTKPTQYKTRTSKPHGVLLHMTQGSNSLSWLQGGSGAASAEYLIRRDGYGYEITPQGFYSYHAGTSRVTLPNGHTYIDNGVSQALIGIEMEATADQSCTWDQYAACANLIVNRLAPRWGWAWPFVMFGHYGVALPFGRRSDPWRFDYGGFMGVLYAYAHERGML